MSNVCEMFDESFVQAVRNVLAELGEGGKTVTVKELAKTLELPTNDKGEPDAIVDGALRALVKHGMDDYEIRTGAGIVKTGEKAVRGPNARSKSWDMDWIAQVAGLLEEHTAPDADHPQGKNVSRRALAAALGKPGSDTEAKISKAYKAGALPGYATSKGFGGGFSRQA